MTLSCPDCDTRDLELVDDNGATDGTTTRIEYYECGNGHRFRKVLTP